MTLERIKEKVNTIKKTIEFSKGILSYSGILCMS